MGFQRTVTVKGGSFGCWLDVGRMLRGWVCGASFVCFGLCVGVRRGNNGGDWGKCWSTWCEGSGQAALPCTTTFAPFSGLG